MKPSISATRVVLVQADGVMRAELEEMARLPEVAATYGSGDADPNSTVYGIQVQDGEMLVGGVTLAGHEIGFFIAPARQRRRYASEAVDVFCEEMARVGFETVEAYVARENLASRRLCERLGFQFSGLAQQSPNLSVGGEKLRYRKILALPV